MKARECPTCMAAMSSRYPERFEAPERSGCLFPLTPAPGERTPRPFDVLCALESPSKDGLLTPALSPYEGERGNRRQVSGESPFMEMGQRGQSVENSWRANLATMRATVLPLPKGEGWGEGKHATRSVTAADISKLPCRHPSPDISYLRGRSAGFQTGLARPHSSSVSSPGANPKPVWKPALRPVGVPCELRNIRVRT